MYWVLATLTDTVIEVDRRYLGRMRRRDRAAYYEESKSVAAAFGIPDDLVPPDYDEFRAYFRDRIATIAPSEQSREVAATLIRPQVRFVPGFAWLPFTLATTELLPARMRRELRIRDLNAAELATVRAAQLSMRNSLGHLPAVVAPNPLNGRAIGDAA
ncbi:MAG: oxygenase MpaB family protein [Microthrixaceae bacterium]